MIKKNLTPTLFLVLILCLTQLYCNTQVNFNDFVPKKMNFPTQNIDYRLYVIRLKNGEILALSERGGEGNWAYAKEGDEKFTEVSFPLEPKARCWQTKYAIYESMPDGRIMVWKNCSSRSGGGTPSTTITSLLTYNIEDKHLIEIISSLPSGASSASWNPEMTKAIAYYQNSFSSATLYWVLEDGHEPADIEIGNVEHSWNLKDDFPDFAGAKTGATGNTGRASWSPDGNSIAFFASPDAIGVTGWSRFHVEYSLYIMSPESLDAHPVHENIYSPFLLQWSPNSKYIAFIGQSGLGKQDGVWLYSLDTDTLTLISKGDFSSLAWKADGNNLVAVRCDEVEVLTCEIIEEYDISKAISNP